MGDEKQKTYLESAQAFLDSLIPADESWARKA